MALCPSWPRRWGPNDVMQSMLVTFSLVLTGVGNLTATTIAQRIGAQRLVYASFVLIFLGVGLLAVAPSLAVFFVAQAFLGLAQGVGYPVTMGLSIRHVSDEERTTAMGLHQSVYAIGMFGGPALSGVLAKWLGMRPMFGITAVACAVSGLLADPVAARESIGARPESHMDMQDSQDRNRDPGHPGYPCCFLCVSSDGCCGFSIGVH